MKIDELSVVIPIKDEPYIDTLKKRIFNEMLKHTDIKLYELVIREDKGCGNAILRGIEESQFKYILVMDGDGSHNPRYIPFMVRLMEKGNNDLVYGKKQVSMDNLYRKIVTKIFDFIARLTVKDYPDLMSGFFMFNREKVLLLPHEISHPKVLMFIVKNNKELKVDYIDIIFEKRKMGKSKLGNMKTGLTILKKMFVG